MSPTTNSRIVRGAVVAALAGGAVAGTIGFSAAAPSAARHTLKFTTTQIADHTSGFHDVAADVDKQGGKIVGYDVSACNINVQTHRGRCDVDIARSAGTMRGRITINLDTGAATGVVTGGTRAYRGVVGTISGKSATESTTAVTIRYHS